MKIFSVFLLILIINSGCRKDPSITASNNILFQQEFAKASMNYTYEVFYIVALADFLKENHPDLVDSGVTPSLPLDYMFPPCANIEVLNLDTVDGKRDGWPRKAILYFDIPKGCVSKDGIDRRGFIKINYSAPASKNSEAPNISFSLQNYSVNGNFMFTAPFMKYSSGSDSVFIRIENSTYEYPQDSLNNIYLNFKGVRNLTYPAMSYTYKGRFDGRDYYTNSLSFVTLPDEKLEFSTDCRFVKDAHMIIRRSNQRYFLKISDECDGKATLLSKDDSLNIALTR